MADQAKIEAAKTRIITHMNADHHDSLIRYLEHHHHLPSYRAYNAHLTDLDLSSLTLTCQNQTYKVPITPLMTSYSEARERLVQMDRDALRALGRDDLTVKTYAPPQGFDLLVFIACVATFLGYSQRWWFADGQVVSRVLGQGFARFSWRIQPWLMAFMVPLHSAEAVWFAWVKLPRYSVNPRTSVFWLWVGSVFIEGVGAQWRFGRMVESLKGEKAKARH